MKDFREFVDKKSRRSKYELNVLKQVFEHNGFKVEDKTKDDEPHLFIKSPNDDLSFGGIRVYKIGSSLAFRVQKESDTHPYGKAYSLNVNEMYEDLITDKQDEEIAGTEVMKAVVQEVKSFFEKSAIAEKDMSSTEIDKKSDAMGRVMIKGSDTSDYSNNLFKKGN